MISHNPKSNLADTERHSHQMELHIVDDAPDRLLRVFLEPEASA